MIPAPVPADAARRPATLALAALVLGAVAIGSSAIWVRLSEVGPAATAFWRTALAVPFLALWVLMERRSAPRTDGGDARGLVAAGCFFAGDLAFWHASILLTSVAAATLLANLAPIFVTLAGWLWFGERVSRRFLLGLGVALVGVVTLLGPDARPAGATALLGDAFGLVTALFYAAYLMQIKRLRERISTARIMAVSSLVTAAIIFPLAWLLGETVLPASARGWGVVLGLALVSHVAGQSLIAYALAHLPAALGAVSLLIQPLFAATFAWLVLGERVGAAQALGGATILVGIAIAHRACVSREPRAA